MFFLTHLLNKPDTEHTGQVWYFHEISRYIHDNLFVGKLCLGDVPKSQMGLLSCWWLFSTSIWTGRRGSNLNRKLTRFMIIWWASPVTSFLRISRCYVFLSFFSSHRYQMANSKETILYMFVCLFFSAITHGLALFFCTICTDFFLTISKSLALVFVCVIRKIFSFK